MIMIIIIILYTIIGNDTIIGKIIKYRWLGSQVG